MTQVKPCPQCQAREFKAEGRGGLRCLGCGAQLLYETPWPAVVVTWVVVGALLGVGDALLAKALGLEHAAALWVPMFLLVAVLSSVISRRFRRLRRT